MEYRKRAHPGHQFHHVKHVKKQDTDCIPSKYFPCPLNNTKRVEVQPLLPFNNEDFVRRQMVERVLTGKVRSLFAIYPTKILLPLLVSILLLLPLILSRVFKIAMFWTSAKFLTSAGGDRGCALLTRPGAHQVIVLVCSLSCSLCCSLWRSP